VLLVILLIAVGLILGFFTSGQALRKLGRVLLIVAFAPVLIGIGKNHFSQLPSEQKLIFAILLSVVAILVVLRIFLGKGLFNEVMGRFIYDGVRAVFMFPFRLISSLTRKYK